MELKWRIFDGGARRNELAAAQSKKRDAQDELTEKHDAATRQVWSAYIAFRTALKKQQAAFHFLVLQTSPTTLRLKPISTA